MALREIKRGGFIAELKSKFLNVKQDYRLVLKSKKSNYRKAQINLLANCNDSRVFWKIINSTRKRRCHKSCIDLPTWLEYLHSCYPEPSSNSVFFDESMLSPLHPFLDVEITYEEVVKSIQHCKEWRSSRD